MWDHNQLKQLVHSYFIVVYLNNDINHDGQNKIITGHFPIIKQSQRDFLNQRVSKEEIKEAIFGMAPFKAPGPDGFHAGFYQKMWHIVGPSICDVVWEFLDTGTLPKALNDTLIILIPKVQDLEQVKKFWSISLCNVVYKAITKMLVNRLKHVLRDIIALTQCSFVPGR